MLGPFRGSQGVLCATYGRYVHIVEVIWARDEVLCGKARFSGDFSTVYSPEAPLCPPLCHTPATTPVPWPRRCLVVALWWPGRALGLRCGLLKAKNTRFSGISMFFWKNGLLKALFLKNKHWIRFIHAILLQKKVLNICFQTFYFFSIPPTKASQLEKKTGTHKRNLAIPVLLGEVKCG